MRHTVLIQILLILISSAGCTSILPRNQPLAPEKIIVIRDDDVKKDTDALKWLSNTIVSNNAKCTYAVIPDVVSDSCVSYLKTLDSMRFEFATHGYDHTPQEDPVAVQAAAKYIMKGYFGKDPLSIAAPYSNITPQYIAKVASLGYHSQINNFVSDGNMSFYTFPMDFAWEKNWTAGMPIYHTLIDFTTAFDTFYSRPSWKVFTINLHHASIYADETGAKENFIRSLDYMNSKHVIFMTEEEAYQAIRKGDKVIPKGK